MKRCAPVVLAASLIVGSFVGMRVTASASPFGDVQPGHWAYAYIQSLAADGLIEGYPDGQFKGDRPMTRYEMATLVARAVAKLRTENHENLAKLASKGDLDKLQRLVFALKDELDGLGVRVSTVEDEVAALDRKTKVAQSIQVHGEIRANGTARNRTTIARTIDNGTGISQPLYYGGVAPAGGSAPADPFVNAFLTSDDTNLPYVANLPGVQLRQNDRLKLSYAINDNLMVSLPIHVLNFEYGYGLAQQQKIQIEPSIALDIAQSGIFSNLRVTYGYLDALPSSRTGLTFRAPFGDTAGDPYADPFQTPLQPTQRGISIAGTVLGLTDFSVAFSRIDQVLLDTQPVLDVAGSNLAGGYLSPVIPAQVGYLQTGAGQSAATLTSDTFAANAGPLSQVYLSRKAVLGSVYVSAYDGSTFDASGRLVATVPGGPPAPPGFQYNDAYNAVVFTAPLIPGSHVTISYAGLSVSANTNFQRYMINARINQKFKGFPGAEVGFTFNRIFDFDGLQTSADVTQAFAQPAIGSGAVSDTVFGLDFQTPLGIPAAATARTPVVYGEIAASNFTADYRHVAPVGDAAAVLGMRLRLHKAHIDLRYQDVGVNYLDGAPYGYFGNAPAVFSFYNGAYLPEFFGFGNTVAINRQFDRQFGANPANPLTAENPNLTFAYPLFNPLRGVGPTFYQAFTPNSRGLTAVATTPIQIGRTTVQTHLEYQHLEDIRPTSLANALGGAIYPTNVHLRDDTYGISTAFNVSAFGKRLAVDLGGAYETLRRPDASTQLYLPYNPATGGPDPAAVAAASAALPGGQSQVPFYPNYIDMRHVTLGAGASFPVSHDLGLSVRYSTQRFAGAYGTTLSQNISERKDFLSGTLTYRIPHSNSTIDFNARTYRYSDPNVPNYDFNQTQQNVNFTVRF